ncbi:MAG: thiamine phosphate synthase, partial [Bacteroidales bacterium]|nr:thiamine phosphate synthase [Bacteroidales bacterium]
MELRLVTREDFFPGEAELIRQMFDLGLDWLHLRKPGSGEDDYRALLMELSPYERSRTVLHEHYHLAPELDAGGIHANSRHPFPFKPTGERSEAKFADERGETAFPDMSHSGPTAAYSGPTAAMLSVSCHSLEELSAHKAKFDYLFLSPIFDSISKKGYSGRFTREQLLEA